MDKNDKFYQECDTTQKKEILGKIAKKKFGPGFLSGDKWHGEIKWCPECKAIRVTGCSACGCGTCFTCQHRFYCGKQYLAGAILNDVNVLKGKFE